MPPTQHQPTHRLGSRFTPFRTRKTEELSDLKRRLKKLGSNLEASRWYCQAHGGTIQQFVEMLEREDAEPDSPIPSELLAQEAEDEDSFPSHSSLKEGIGKERNLRVLDAPALLAQKVRKQKWLWDGYLLRGRLALLIGLPKSGKTTIAYELALAVARGVPFLNRATRKTGVLIIAVEEHLDDVRSRLRGLGLRPGDAVSVIQPPVDDSPETLAGIRKLIKKRRIGFVIIDSLSTYWSVKNESSPTEVNVWLRPVLDLARTTGATWLLIHHERKAGGSEGREIRGAGTLHALTDHVLTLRRLRGNSNPRRRNFTAGGRYGIDGPPSGLVIELQNGRYIAIGPSNSSSVAEARVLLRSLAAHPQTISQLVQSTHLSSKRLASLLNSPALAGRVEKRGRGRKRDPYVYHLTPGTKHSVGSTSQRQALITRRSEGRSA